MHEKEAIEIKDTLLRGVQGAVTVGGSDEDSIKEWELWEKLGSGWDLGPQWWIPPSLCKRGNYFYQPVAIYRHSSGGRSVCKT